MPSGRPLRSKWNAPNRNPVSRIAAHGSGSALDLSAVTLLPPIDHDDTAHLLLTGTGLTHLGSAEGRDKMHRSAAENPAPTDSMKMFKVALIWALPVGGVLIAAQLPNALTAPQVETSAEVQAVAPQLQQFLPRDHERAQALGDGLVIRELGPAARGDVELIRGGGPLGASQRVGGTTLAYRGECGEGTAEDVDEQAQPRG